MGFRYQPLNPGEFRLLKPLSKSSNSLTFEIVHVPLSATPRYSALSYTWGPPGDTHRIVLNGNDFPIRQNLHDALLQIRISKLVEQYLWVDAICINQGQTEEAENERSFQITLMKQIYEHATEIIVWLGKPENEGNNRLAFLMMKDFSKQYRHMLKKARPYRPWWWKAKPRTVGQDIADFLITLTPSKNKKVFDVPGTKTYSGWLGIISLWKSPWWTRTWIFQESTVPESMVTRFVRGVYVAPLSSKVKFLCGDQTTSWPEIDTTTLVATSILSTPDIQSQFLVDASKSVDQLIRFRSHRILLGVPSFLELLQMFRHTQCFDPRDKVYAPLCLASEDVYHYIKPDYRVKTVLDVYLDVVKYCLAEPGHDLDFLGYVYYQKEEQLVKTPQGIESILPSWVPNFAASINSVPIPKVLHVPEEQNKRRKTFIDRSGVPNKDEKLVTAYHPLGDTPSRSFIEGNTLYVSGVYIDSLKDIVPETGPDLEAIRAVGKEKGRKWAVESKHKYFTGESYTDAVKRTLMLDLVYNELGKPSERGGKADLAFLRRPRAEISQVEYRYQMNMRSSRTKASTLRSLALSQKLYLLMVPRTASVGDVIWALAGGQVLYTLRPLNREMNQYIIIGECYAHGLMDGEITRRLHVGEVVLEDISLV